MADQLVDGLSIHYQRSGQGQAIVLVHGSWDDHRSWDRVTQYLQPSFDVVRYDRRGHGASECPPGQGRIGEDVEDLAGLIESLGIAPCHILGHSYGASVALLCALARPALCRTVTVHEPPLFALLSGTPYEHLFLEVRQRMAHAVGLLDTGQTEAGAAYFADEVGFGPGTWDTGLSPELRRTFVANAHTWLDQARDPDRLALDRALLARMGVPVLVTHGDAGLPWYNPTVELLVDAMPGSRRHLIPGSGHAAHLTHPEQLADATRGHALAMR